MEYAHRVNGKGQTDFQGHPSRSITVPSNREVHVALTVDSGDLTRDIEAGASDETGQLIQAQKKMNQSLVNIVGRVRNGTDAIAIASSQIAAGNLDR